MNQFAALNDKELAELSTRIYHATMKFFERAQQTFGEMAQTQTWNPVYDEMRAHAAVLMSAGREQGELGTALMNEARDRRERAARTPAQVAEAKITAHRDEILASWADDAYWMRQAQANEEGNQAGA